MDKKQLEEGLELNIQFDKYPDGLAPVIVQDAVSKDVLMQAWADKRALEITLEKGYATFWTRSRKEYWTKGETSGNRLVIKEIRIDCDQDVLLYLVEKEEGGACHTENKDGEARNSCFYRRVADDKLEFLEGMQ